MKLVKTTFFSALITFVRISSGFIAGKAIAIYTGPSGVALVGSFTNFISIVLTFANGAIGSGVVKYTAEYKEDVKQSQTLFTTAFKISLYCSSAIGLILIIFAPQISLYILKQELYSNPVRVLGFTIIFYSINNLLGSILNGRSQIKVLTLVNTIGSIVGLIFTIVLVYFFNLPGALYALVLSQSIVFFATLAIIYKNKIINLKDFTKHFDKEIAIKLGKFGLMAIVSALALPLSQIILRNLIIKHFGINAAGQWQGMMRVSDGYLMIITTSLSTYYLPKLSSLKKPSELRAEIFNGYKLILPAVLVGCIIIYFLRFFIIRVLYTADFMEMESLFFWQLVGDFLKMAAWILSYLMLARAMTKLFVVSEIIFTISYILLSHFYIQFFGLKGMTMAFATNYLLYLIFMLITFSKLLRSKYDSQ